MFNHSSTTHLLKNIRFTSTKGLYPKVPHPSTSPTQSTLISPIQEGHYLATHNSVASSSTMAEEHKNVETSEPMNTRKFLNTIVTSQVQLKY